jgi:hypothetical protein
MSMVWEAAAAWMLVNVPVILVGLGVFFFLLALIRRLACAMRGFALLAGLTLVAAGIVSWLFGGLPSLPLLVQSPQQPTPPPTPTAVIVSFPESEAFAGQAEVPSAMLAVSAAVEQGVSINILANGEYEIAYLGDSYSPWPSDDHPGYLGWTTLVAVYNSRPVEWGLTPYEVVGPVNPDGFLTAGGYFSTREVAADAAVGERLTLSLRAGDQLLLVAVDERGRYADNRGLVEVEIRFQGP